MMRIIGIVNDVRRVPQQGASVTGDSGPPRGQVSLPNGIVYQEFKSVFNRYPQH